MFATGVALASIVTERITYPSPNGHGEVNGYLVRPAGVTGKLPAVLVVHENRGLNPYIEDVARRMGKAGFMALAPDGLTSVGGYPGNDDEGRELQRTVDGTKLMNDFFAGFEYLRARDDCTGKVGAVGFCYGGGVVNAIAVAYPELAAGVPFYGRQPKAEDVASIQAPLLLQYAAALKAPQLDTVATSLREQIRVRTTDLTASNMPPTWTLDEVRAPVSGLSGALFALPAACTPDAAEQAVEDLSSLFRASLKDSGSEVTLAEELALCERYIRIEQLRLGERLGVEWRIELEPESVALPLLTLQPLLENAIYHGIQPLTGGGVVRIAAAIEQGRVVLRVGNPKQEGASEHQGNRMALDNIRHRLEALHGPSVSVSARSQQQHYEIEISYPLQ